MKWLLILSVLVGCSSTGGAAPDAAATAADAAADAASDVTDDASEAGPPSCAPGAMPGADQGSVKTPAGTSVLVRIPAGYDPTVGAPLIIVYAACCVDGAMMEEFTLLTPPATSAGYLIAYADHISPTSAAEFTDAANVLPAVSAQYCVDPANVFLTGHSDGGSLDEVLAIEGLVPTQAIAPSASGLPVSDVTPAQCPKAQVSVFEQHSSGDELFPLSEGYGADVAGWWAQCDGCGAEGPARSDGCLPYLSCSGALQVLYCQGTAVHGIWPDRDAAIIAFFDQYRVP
jgi:polyhydroxybutyrate depolymerase